MKENRNSIVKKLLFASDVVVYLQKYIEVMNAYYKNMDNQYKDEFVYSEYVNFKKECEKGAKERGLI